MNARLKKRLEKYVDKGASYGLGIGSLVGALAGVYLGGVGAVAGALVGGVAGLAVGAGLGALLALLVELVERYKENKINVALNNQRPDDDGNDVNNVIELEKSLSEISKLAQSNAKVNEEDSSKSLRKSYKDIKVLSKLLGKSLSSGIADRKWNENPLYDTQENIQEDKRDLRP